jgi:nitrite reductase/ring-hydroxylating ferredoxin subunit
MENFETVLRTPDLGPGSLTEVQAHGRTLALANVGQTYYALEGVCPADGSRLGEAGRLEGDYLICPRDHAFDVRDGQATEGGGDALKRYTIRITGNEIQVGPPLDGEG